MFATTLAYVAAKASAYLATAPTAKSPQPSPKPTKAPILKYFDNGHVDSGVQQSGANFAVTAMFGAGVFALVMGVLLVIGSFLGKKTLWPGIGLIVVAVACASPAIFLGQFTDLMKTMFGG